MPIYMDSHIVPGVEAEHVAAQHKRDLGVQDQFGCRNMTYWVDEDRGRVFCLIDAPNEEAVRQMHDHAHGDIPHEIITVNSKVVEAFLGRISDPDAHFHPGNPYLKIINDPAFRIIMVAKIRDMGLLIHGLGKKKAKKLATLYFETLKKQIFEHEGSEVEIGEDAFVVSFTSVSQAVDCALAVQKALHFAMEPLGLQMALHAGLPVDTSAHLFGKTVSLAGYLCSIAEEKRIVLSSVVSGLVKPELLSNTADNHGIGRISEKEEEFLSGFVDLVQSNWQDPQYAIGDFCKALGVSKSQLYRKCMGIAHKPANVLLREYRLQKALYYLGKKGFNVSQTTFETGFNSPSYFTKCFQKQFGIQPLGYSKLLLK